MNEIFIIFCILTLIVTTLGSQVTGLSRYVWNTTQGLKVKKLCSTHRHVVLGDEGGHLELVARHHGVEELHAGQVVHLGLDGRRHERREPPGHHLLTVKEINKLYYYIYITDQ